MKEISAPPMPSLYDALVDALDTEDTDPFGVLPFTQQLEIPAKAPAPRRLRTHLEYQTARFREWWYRREKPLTVRVEVGAWVLHEDDDETVIVDIDTIVAANRLGR